MGSSRHDVQRLFRHFGLDPSEYVDSFALKPSALAAVPTPRAGARSDYTPHVRGESDLFDYRNFELGR